MTQDAPPETVATEEPLREWRGPNALRALRHRNFALFWFGLLISATGSWMQSVAQGWLVYKLTGSKLYLGLVGTMGTLPILILSLPCGVVADRFDKRKITVVTQSLATVQALILAALVYTGVIRPWHLLALAAFSGLINSLDVPARQAMTMELCGKDDILNGVALNSSAFNGARIVGPAIAGVIIAAHGEAACFFINGISYLAVIASLLVIRTNALCAERNGQSVCAQIGEGLRYARRNTVIRDILVLTGVASIFGLQYGTLMPAFAAKEVLDVGPRGLGILMSGAGLGALSAALSVAALGHLFRQGTVVIIGSILAPVGLIAFALSPSFYLSVACLVVTGFGMMLFLAVSNSIVQLASPDEMRGRMLSVRTLAFMGFAPIGALLSGGLAQLLGVRQAVLLGGAICLISGLVFGMRSRPIREAGFAREEESRQ